MAGSPTWLRTKPTLPGWCAWVIRSIQWEKVSGSSANESRPMQAYPKDGVLTRGTIATRGVDTSAGRVCGCPMRRSSRLPSPNCPQATGEI